MTTDVNTPVTQEEAQPAQTNDSFDEIEQPVAYGETFEDLARSTSTIEVPWQEDDTDPRMPRDRSMRSTAGGDSWLPAQLLPQPEARPGFEHRYIRTGTRGSLDNTNISKKFREGWIPCSRTEYTEITVPNDVDARYPDAIEIGGCLLCKMPTEMLMQRRRYYQRLANNAMTSVDNSMFKEQSRKSNMKILSPVRSSTMKNRGDFGRD